MSKGPGHVERVLIQLFFDGKVDNAFTTEELCERVYPNTVIARKHRVAVLRAAQRLRKRQGYEDLHSWEGGNLGATMVWFNHANVMSYAMARLKADKLYNYRNRDPREFSGSSEKELRVELRRGGDHYSLVKPGGSWHRHTQNWITERDLRRRGDTKRLKKFLAKQEAESAALRASFVAKARQLLGK